MKTEKIKKEKDATTNGPEVDELKSEHPTVNPLDNIYNTTVNPETDVTDMERELLDKTDLAPDDAVIAEKIKLDQTDGEDPLNQQANPNDMGEDLDVPGAELDDSNEEIGEEDEENNPYSNSNKHEE